jgi:hypothetical protein
MTERIEQSELEPILAAQQARQAFARALRRIESSEQLLRALGRYIHFNSLFGGGVANLAGAVAARQDLFRDSAEASALLADRSIEVAADIFSAAVDEFGGGGEVRRHTHRTLAQATLKGLGEFCGCTALALDRLVRLNDATLTAINRVQAGYGLNRALDEGALFRALGFHIGSELLADEEFRTLDAFLRTQHAKLVRYLESHRAALNGGAHPAYLWIHIHTSVEAEHCADAIISANQALRYYAGTERVGCIKEWIIAGFAEFVRVQAEFMEGLNME